MGLFDKKYCDVCGEKIGLLGNRKLEDGNLCKDCAKKLSPWFNERRHSSVDEIKAQLEYREENKQRVARFNVTRCIGEHWWVLLDEVNRCFTVTRNRNIKDGNPDIIDYDAITGCRLDIDEDEVEIMREGSDGKKEHYNPPRYKYKYDFYLVINVNNPYFDEIKVKLNSEIIEITNQSTVQISFMGRTLGGNNRVNPEVSMEYCKYRDMGEEICNELNNARGLGKSLRCSGCGWSPAQGEAVPRFCPECGRSFN